MNKHTTTQSGFANIWLIAAIALLAIGGVGYYAYSSQQNDQENDTETVQQEQTAENEDTTGEEDEDLEGFSLFNDAETGIEFVYPDSWGEVTMTRDDFPHDGDSYRIEFNANSEVLAGVKSSDFAYTGPPRGGFGVVGYGFASFDDQLANIQQANQERLDGNDGYSVVIANQSSSHVMYAGLDLTNVGYYLSLAIQERSGDYGALEFTYVNDTQPNPDSETGNALSVISDRYVEEFNDIVSANQVF